MRRESCEIWGLLHRNTLIVKWECDIHRHPKSQPSHRVTGAVILIPVIHVKGFSLTNLDDLSLNSFLWGNTPKNVEIIMPMTGAGGLRTTTFFVIQRGIPKRCISPHSCWIRPIRAANQFPDPTGSLPPPLSGTHTAPNNQGPFPVWHLSSGWVSYAVEDELHVTIALKRIPSA